MVTLSKYGAKYNRNILFLEGLSTDTKPTGEFDGLSIQNGSEYTEVDTGKKFLFDYDNATWYEMPSGGGGGGGGGTSNYNDLSNRPSVNNTVLTGNKTSAQLGLASSEQGGKADSAIQGVKLNSGSAITPDANNIVDVTVGKADVGLGNVTNDAQVKKISSSTSGDIVTWSGTSGDTVADSGVSIETSITDSDLKIPTSKAVNTALSGKQATIDSSHKLSADLVDNSTPTFATATQGGKADTAVQTIKVNSASTGVIKTGDTVDITAIPASIVSAGALANGMTATTQETSEDNDKLATTAFVHDVVDSLPSPMVYKGTLGTGGTKTTLPVDGTVEVGDTYKVITAGTYASQAAKVGDMFICLTKATSSNTWSYVPSGDDTDVTQVSAGTGLTTASGSPITTTGTIKAKLKSGTALAEAATNSTTSGKSYAVNVDSNGDLACNVPWTDTTYSAATTTTAGLMSAQDKTDLGNVKTQANWNTNNGVKNLSPISGGTVSGSGRVAKLPCNIPAGTYIICWVSTATTGSSVLTFFNNGTQIAQGGFNNDTALHYTQITLSSAANEIELYTNVANTISDVMVCPKSLYDADSTFEPYALPNTKITPELIDLVDSGAKNELPPFNTNFTPTANISYSYDSEHWIDVDITGTVSAYTQMNLLNGYISNTFAGKHLYFNFSNNPSNVHAKIAYSSNGSTAAATIETVENGYTITGDYPYIGVFIVIDSGATQDFKFKAMICTKAAWDVSQKFVPYRPTYAETVAQVAENETNISKCPKVLVRSSTSVTGSTTLADTGVSYVIPSGEYVRISATVRYSADSSNPEEVALDYAGTIIAHTEAVSGDITTALTTTTVIGGYTGDKTIRVLARTRTAATVSVMLFVESIPNPN